MYCYYKVESVLNCYSNIIEIKIQKNVKLLISKNVCSKYHVF